MSTWTDLSPGKHDRGRYPEYWMNLRERPSSLCEGFPRRLMFNFFVGLGAQVLKVPKAIPDGAAGIVLSCQGQPFESIYITLDGSLALFQENPLSDTLLDREVYAQWDYLHGNTCFKVLLGCGEPAGLLEYSLKYHRGKAITSGEVIAQAGNRLMTTMAFPGTIVLRVPEKELHAQLQTLNEPASSSDGISEALSRRMREMLNLRCSTIIANDTLRHFKSYRALIAWTVYDEWMRTQKMEVKLPVKNLRWYLDAGETYVKEALDFLQKKHLISKRRTPSGENSPFYTFNRQAIIDHYNESVPGFVTRSKTASPRKQI